MLKEAAQDTAAHASIVTTVGYLAGVGAVEVQPLSPAKFWKRATIMAMKNPAEAG